MKAHGVFVQALEELLIMCVFRSPRRRSLLCSIDLKASPTYGESSDGIVVVNMLPQGVMVARWVVSISACI